MGASLSPDGPHSTMPDPYGDQVVYNLDRQKDANEFEARLRAILVVSQLHRITS